MYFSIPTIGQFLNILVVWANRSETPSLTIRQTDSARLSPRDAVRPYNTPYRVRIRNVRSQ